MEAIEKLKTKLQQKKNRLAAEEIKLALKERKMRTRHLIEVGGLVVKAGLDYLPAATLYGALSSLKQSLNKDSSVQDQWANLGKELFDKESKTKTSVILKFIEKPSAETRTHIRAHGLKWNKIREEWYGHCADLKALKDELNGIKFDLQIT